MPHGWGGEDGHIGGKKKSTAEEEREESAVVQEKTSLEGVAQPVFYVVDIED